MDFSYKKRRRSIVVTSTSPAASVQAIPPPGTLVVPLPRAPRRAVVATVLSGHTSYQHNPGDTPTKAVVVPRLTGRRSAPASYVTHTAPPTPSILPPPYEPFIRPQIVQRLARPSQLPTRAIVLRAAVPVPPPPRGDSTRPTVPKVVHRPRRLPPPTLVISTHPGFANVANFKATTRVVPRPVPRTLPTQGRPAIVLRPLFENRPLVLPYPDPLVVPRPGLRALPNPGKPAVVIRTAKPIIPGFTPIVTPRLAPRVLPTPGRPAAVIRPPVSPPGVTPRQAIVVPAPRRKALVLPAIDPYDLKPSPQRAITPTMPTPLGIVVMPPLVVPRRAAVPVIRRSTVVWTGSDLRALPSFPVVQSRLAALRRAAPTAVITGTHIPITMTPDPVGEGYYDIIAASIGWLRTNAALVATFGDSPATGVNKFASDTLARSLDPPYAVFHEPQEHTSFESKDLTGQRSAVVEGVYTIEVFGVTKVDVRKHTDLIGDWLSDAPLVFDEGVLLYIKAVDHQYPTLEVPGPGTNVVMYKRAIDFEYKFERYIAGQ